MKKQRVAIVTVELLLQPGGPALSLTEAIEHVDHAINMFKQGPGAIAPLRYSDHNVIDARLVRDK